MKSAGKSDFAGLTAYITDPQSKDHRLGNVQLTNCASATQAAAIEEILATQHQNKRATGDKTYHLIVSFRAGENPSQKVLADIEDRISQALGFGEHQRITAVHTDTDNLHMHIAINKIHPTKHTMHDPFRAYKTLSEICTVLEKEHELQRDNHESKQTISQARAQDMERHSGIESLVSFVRTECVEKMRSATTWAEMHSALAENGLKIKPRANGLVVEDSTGLQVKASTIGREFSKQSLESRFGMYEAPANQPVIPKRQYKKEPLKSHETVELYSLYKKDTAIKMDQRRAMIAKFQGHKADAIKAAKRKNALRRSTIKITESKGIDKRFLYKQAYAALKEDMHKIHSAYSQAVDRLGDSKKKTWADWLRHEAINGNIDAMDALRTRKKTQTTGGSNYVRGEGGANSRREHQRSQIDGITKTGTIIYKGGAAIRDDGTKIQVSKTLTKSAVEDALQRTIDQYGSKITVHGTAEFKAMVLIIAAEKNLNITFSEHALETRREALTREKQNGRTNQGEDGGRTNRGSVSGSRPAVTDLNKQGATHQPTPVAGRSESLIQGHTRSTSTARTATPKPGIGRIGARPPTQSKNRVRTVSQLNVANNANGSKVLLPSNVPVHLDEQRANTTNELRRGISRAGVKDDAIAAAEKYIAERDQTRLKIYDIPKHKLYNNEQGSFQYVGIRSIDGKPLALLLDKDEILVMPIDPATERRLKRIKTGEAVTTTPKGSIRTKGNKI